MTSGNPNGRPKLPLDQLMSDLLRASVGSSAAGVADGDLDKCAIFLTYCLFRIKLCDFQRYVAEMIAAEARQKRERYERNGLNEYVRPTGPSPPLA